MQETKLTQMAMKVLDERYLKDGETPDDLFWRVAQAIAKAELEYGNDAVVAKMSQRFFDLMQSGKFLPNSPTLMNAGLDNNLQYSACYVLPVEDSVDGVFDTVKNAALIHKTGGGTGFSFSRIRPRGSRVNSTGGVASGPVSFMRVFDGATEAIKQGGKRRGANMGVLRVDHPDIEEFITSKIEGGITNFNISVAITKRFMIALDGGVDYDLIAQPDWPNPDGGRYEGGEVIGKRSARTIFALIRDTAWRTGDPGLIFIDRVNDSTANPTPGTDTIETCNPCVTGDTLIYTENGLAQAKSLYYQGQPVRVVSDSRRGEQLHQSASNVFPTGKKEIYKLKTKEGYSVRLTGNHRVMTNRRWVEADQLVKGDKIHIFNRRGGFGTYGNREIGLSLGWLVGDGTITPVRAVLSFFGAEKRKLAEMFAETVDSVVDGMQQKNRAYSVGVLDIPERDESRVQSTRLKKLASMYGFEHGDKHLVPAKLFLGTESMQRGFLQALFTTDGGVQGTKQKGFSVRLSQSNESLLEQVQLLLLNFGIASRIYRNRREAGYRLLPDSNRNPKKYWCKSQHDLSISKDNLIRFQEEIGFLTSDKREKLSDVIASFTRGPRKEPFTATFDSLVEDGIEEVYDLTEPITNSFVANGLVVHNCGEQFLFANDACNLGSIDLAKFIEVGDITWDELAQATRTAIRFLDNVITVNPYPLPVIDRVVKANRRVGLGVMGWSDTLFKLGIAYDSEEALTLADEVMGIIKQSASKETIKLAKKRGPFPNHENSRYALGSPRRNATLTAIAPTGSISIIAGTSSGIEPAFALAFRHIVKQPEGNDRILTFVNPIFEQVAKDRGFWSQELMAKILETGSVHGLDEVPEEIQRVFVTSHEITPEWHVKMQAFFQKHTDNGVSKTINMPNSATRQQVEDAYLLAYETVCLGITIFRDGCKDVQVLNIGAGVTKLVEEVSIALPAVKPRDAKLSGVTYRKSTPVGTAYITINSDKDGNPFEIFVNVGKAGSDVFADAEGLGRLISLCFRSGLATEDVIGQLRGIGSGRQQGFGPHRIMSLADAIAQALGEHIGLKNGKILPGLPESNDNPDIVIGDLCPECGQASFMHEEGCRKCYGCGHSEC